MNTLAIALIATVMAAAFAAPSRGAAPPRCGGRTATIVGTEVGETVNGTAGDDVIVAGGGGDNVNGRGGDDLLCGGPGRDFLTGGAGNDLIDGGFHFRDAFMPSDHVDGVRVDLDEGTARGEGSDTLKSIEQVVGTAGRDVLLGSNEPDWFAGVEGTDVMRGRGGNDRLYLGVAAGPDGRGGTVWGGPGNDQIVGGTGADALLGGWGRDEIYGQSGHDHLDSGGGADIVKGGAGHDTATAGPGDDTVLAGRGNDDVSGDSGADELNGGHGEDDTIDAGDGIDDCREGETYASCEITEPLPL